MANKDIINKAALDILRTGSYGYGMKMSQLVERTLYRTWETTGDYNIKKTTVRWAVYNLRNLDGINVKDGYYTMDKDFNAPVDVGKAVQKKSVVKPKSDLSPDAVVKTVTTCLENQCVKKSCEGCDCLSLMKKLRRQGYKKMMDGRYSLYMVYDSDGNKNDNMFPFVASVTSGIQNEYGYTWHRWRMFSGYGYRRRRNRNPLRAKYGYTNFPMESILYKENLGKISHKMPPCISCLVFMCLLNRGHDYNDMGEKLIESIYNAAKYSYKDDGLRHLGMVVKAGADSDTFKFSHDMLYSMVIMLAVELSPDLMYSISSADDIIGMVKDIKKKLSTNTTT